jgi:hypothetical protein
MHKETAVCAPWTVRGLQAKAKAVAQLLLSCIQTVLTVRTMINICNEPMSLSIQRGASFSTSARAR